MLDFVISLRRFFGMLYKADKRPEARRFTIGCFLVSLVLLALIYLIFGFLYRTPTD